MKMTILAVGRCKEAYWNKAIEEYSRRLGRYCTLEIREVADEKTPDGASENQARQRREREGERLLKLLREDAYCIALDIRGQEVDSVELSRKIESLGVGGVSHIQFVIGGSLGLSDEVLRRADWRLSFSRMTFPHQLMRVILLEQIYRSWRIARHEPYHK
ncbi:MAG: 23S rRNA (pseudouridine(1915)-N(3))-methyltransferase RlmH [Lachnospiraceae bacterium]|nr:23S rRNA (pseudouridine(1915)-N(3))-methyltransferase RlmH [Lachnospiraceae bacterium]